MFYIDTTTKKFTAGPYESTSSGECCYCCEGTDVPLFLRTKVMNPSLIQKPKLVHYQTAIIQLSLRDSQGFPYDLADKELVLAIDNTFQHSDSLIALSSDFLVLDAQQGIVQFTVKCSSRKFQKMVNNKIPASQVWMQITSYSPEDIQGTVILQDRGIILAPKLYTTEGIPEDNDPNYYNKQQTRAVIAAYIKIAEALSNSIVALNGKFSNYYDKEAVDAIAGALSDSITAVRSAFNSYYNKQQIDSFISAVSDSLSTIRGAFGNYYTKGQVNQLIDGISNSADLSNYYTKGQVVVLLEALSDSFNSKLQNYYTSTQVDGITGALSNSIADLKQSLGNYYTKDQTDAFIEALSDSIQDIRDTHYTKTQVDALLDAVPQVQGIIISFNQVNNNIATFTGVNTVPVQVMTNKGSIYPVQKGSLVVDYSDASFTLDVTPYLAYDNSQAFTGTWRLYMAAGSAQGFNWQDFFCQQTVQLSSTSFTPQANKVYVHTLQQSDSITFDTSAFTSTRQVTFQLHLTQPSTAVTFSWPSGILWGDGKAFKSSNTPPDMSVGDVQYCVVIRWDGKRLLGNPAYQIQSDSLAGS